MQDVGFWSAAAVLPLSKAQAWLAHSIIRTQEADEDVEVSARMTILNFLKGLQLQVLCWLI